MITTGYLLSIQAFWDQPNDWTPKKVFVGKNASERADKEAEEKRNNPSNQYTYRFTVDEIEVEIEHEE